MKPVSSRIARCLCFGKATLLLAFVAAFVSAANAASVGGTVVWRNSGADFGTDANQGTGNYSWNFTLPALDGLPVGSVVRITNISFGSDHAAFTSGSTGNYNGKDANRIAIHANTSSASDWTTYQYSGYISLFDNKPISAHGTLVNRSSYDFSGIEVTVGNVNAISFWATDGAAIDPRVKLVKSSTECAFSANDTLKNGGWYPVYEVTATVVSLGSAADTTATVSGNASLSGLSWSTAITTDGTQWATIDVMDNATLTIDAVTNFKLITLNVAEGKTLTLTGANALTATKIDVTGKGKVAAGAGTLSGALTGGGEVVYSGAAPTGITCDYDWAGVVAVENMTGITGDSSLNFNNLGNVASAVRLSGVDGWIDTAAYTTSLILENGDYEYALKLTNGNSPLSNNANRSTSFLKLSGDGSVVCGKHPNGTYIFPTFRFYDGSGFTGSLDFSTEITVRPVFVFANVSTTLSDSYYNLFTNKRGTVYIGSGNSATLAAGESWYLPNLQSYGNFTANGTLSANGEVVVPTGSLPSGNAFTNENWTGTVKISNVATAYPLNLHEFGSANSTLELTSIGATKAYLAGNVTFPGKLELVDDGNTVALALNDGLSGQTTTIHELAGSGRLTQSGVPKQGIVINVMTNFTGTITPYNMCVTIGTTARSGDSYAGKLYIDSNAVLSVPAGFALWNPTAVVIDGPVDFTTSGALTDGMVLFANAGAHVTFGENAAFTINGAAIDPKKYRLGKSGNNIVLRKIRCLNLIFR